MALRLAAGGDFSKWAPIRETLRWVSVTTLTSSALPMCGNTIEDDGIINEIGNLMGGGVSSRLHQFELVNDMDELTRTKIAGEIADSTLKISTTGKGDATLFDQYNEFLSFRKTEYLVIDDGATANEVFELLLPTLVATAGRTKCTLLSLVLSINVDAGGTDHVFLARGADTVNVIGTVAAGDSVTIHDIGAGDTIKLGGTTQTVTAGDVMGYFDESGFYSYTQAEWDALT